MILYIYFLRVLEKEFPGCYFLPSDSRVYLESNATQSFSNFSEKIPVSLRFMPRLGICFYRYYWRDIHPGKYFAIYCDKI